MPRRKELLVPTHLSLDDKLVEEARRLGEHKTRKAAVMAALREYVQRRNQLGIVELFGTIEFDRPNDHRAKRRR